MSKPLKIGPVQLWSYLFVTIVFCILLPGMCNGREPGKEAITDLKDTQALLDNSKGENNHKESRGKMRDSVEEIKALVSSLVHQVTNVKKSQARDRSHIRHLENQLSVILEDNKSMKNDLQVTMATVSQSNEKLKETEESQKENVILISDLQKENEILKLNVDDLFLNMAAMNGSVKSIVTDVIDLELKGTQLEDMMTTAVQETSILRSHQQKLKSGLKHLKLELAGFIQELLPDDDDDIDDDDFKKNSELSKTLQRKNKERMIISQPMESSENSAQLPSDALPLEGSGNVDKIVDTDAMKRNKVSAEPKTKQNEKKIKKEIKVMKETLQAKDIEMERLQTKVLNLSLDVSKLENKVLVVNKDSEIIKTQQMATNVTQYLIALDQWRIASPAIINRTRENQEELDVLGDLILQNKKELGALEIKLIENQYHAEESGHSLETALQKINETLKKVKHRIHHHDHAMSEELSEQFDEVRHRLNDLGTRLMTLEVKVLNSSLNTCAKQQSDFYQDLKLKEFNKKVDKVQESFLVHSETLSRMDRGLYRLHLDIKSHKDSIDYLKKEVKKANNNLPVFRGLQEEMEKFMHHLPRDCSDVHRLGHIESGEYIIHPTKSLKAVRVFCDMADDGGWTVIQRRLDGSENFARPWAEYKDGFGKVDQEFWLGNEYIHLLTNQRNCSLLIEMLDTSGKIWVAKYEMFKLRDETDKYSLFVSGYQGNATDSLGDSKGMAFSTEDRDQDSSSTHCALYYTAGWWYKHCHYCNLNGRYNVGIVWFNQKVNEWLQMKGTVMKILSN